MNQIQLFKTSKYFLNFENVPQNTNQITLRQAQNIGREKISQYLQNIYERCPNINKFTMTYKSEIPLKHF